MKPDEKNTAYIREAWSQMLTKEDLLALLNYAKPLAYESKTVPFELKQLTWYANPKINSKRYSTFSTKKKSGGERIIHAPVKGLKAIQKTLAYILQCVHEPHKAAMGFVRERSIVDNARLHEGQKYIYNIDLKDFFPSVDQARVWKCLQLPPLNLNNKQRKERQWFQLIHPGIGSVTTSKGEVIFYKIAEDRNNVQLLKKKGDYTVWIERVEQIAKEHAIPAQKIIADSLTLLIKEKYTKLLVEADRSKLANIIAAICCTEMEVERKNEQEEWVKVKRNVLPQGAPTSPVLTNIVCQKLDFLLSGVAKRFGLRYSRYADDITFSSMHNVYQLGSEFFKELYRIIKEQGFHINESKTRLQKEGFRQEVTGLLVNEKVNVQQRYIKQLRMWLYYWETYGYEKAYVFFLQHYVAPNKSGNNGKPDMACVISGKLDYLRMVKGVEYEQYLKLKSRFDKITGRTKPTVPVENITKKGQIRLREILEKMMERKKGQVNKQAPPVEEEVSLPSEEVNVVPVQAPPSKTSEQSLVPYKHKPKELIQLLSLFSENKHPLKYACHSWDYGKVEDVFESYVDFIHQFDERGRSICFEIQKIKKTLGTKVLHFLNTVNENGSYFIKNERRDYSWGQHGMRYGWKSQELAEWAKQHPELDPFDFPLPNKLVIRKGNRDVQISRFGDVVKIFKDEIEIRAEDMALYNMFAELRRKHLGFDFIVKLDDNLKGKQFYTDVHEFKRALNKLFIEIGKRTTYPKVDISAVNYPNEGHTLIEILHHQSFCYDKSSDEMIAEVKDGDFGDVLGYLENLCDWSIESKFSDGCYRINYLSASEAALAKEEIPNSEGFRHTFKFYKK